MEPDGELKKPTAELPTSTVELPGMSGNAVKTNIFERNSRYAYPKIGIDGGGRVWLTYRRNFGSRHASHPGSYPTPEALIRPLPPFKCVCLPDPGGGT